MTVPMPGRGDPVTAVLPAGRGTGAGAAEAALGLRDQALAALDAGDPRAALALVGNALSALARAGLYGGPDEAAVLVARAEIEEALDRFGPARAATAAAIGLLGGDGGPGGADGDL